MTYLAMHPQQKQPNGLSVFPLHQNWNKDSCKEMLIRLNEVVESMQPNLVALNDIKTSQINVESHSELRDSLNQLAAARNRCKDANKVILDLTFRYC